MRSVASSLRSRVLAVAILLALRPCVALLNAEFLDSQSTNQARIEYIDDDIAIERVAFVRPTYVRGSHSLAPSIAFLRGLAGIRPPVEASFENARPRFPHTPIFLIPVTLPRAPPLS